MGWRVGSCLRIVDKQHSQQHLQGVGVVGRVAAVVQLQLQHRHLVLRKVRHLVVVVEHPLAMLGLGVGHRTEEVHLGQQVLLQVVVPVRRVGAVGLPRPQAVAVPAVAIAHGWPKAVGVVVPVPVGIARSFARGHALDLLFGVGLYLPVGSCFCSS